MPVSRSGVILVLWTVPNGVSIGLPPVKGRDKSAVWQDAHMPRWARLAPRSMRVLSKEGIVFCGASAGRHMMAKAMPVNTTMAARSSHHPICRLRLGRFMRAPFRGAPLSGRRE